MKRVHNLKNIYTQNFTYILHLHGNITGRGYVNDDVNFISLFQ